MKKFAPLVGALLAALAVVPDVEAGPFRNRGAKSACATCAPTFGGTVSTGCGPNGCPLGSAQSSNFAAPGVATVTSGSALDEVNAQRRQFGLPPLIEDPLLTAGAAACSSFRAAHGIRFHTRNDFAFIPAGGSARAGGTGRDHPSGGWSSCCVKDRATYGGAAYAIGSDGQRYMTLFVR